MTFHQLQLFRRIVQSEFHLSEAARKSFITQPGLSRQILQLEAELGQTLFVRKGKSLLGLTKAGEALWLRSQQVFVAIEGLHLDLDEIRDENQGELRLGATHTQARYFLPRAVTEFRKKYPKVRLQISQGSPMEIAEKLRQGEVDFAMATEFLAAQEDLYSLPLYRWKRLLIFPHRHPLKKQKEIGLSDLCHYPLVTYMHGVAGRAQMDRIFAAHELIPEVVLSAVDSDVIKTYVALGMGIGIVAGMAYDSKIDKGLYGIAAPWFGENVSFLAFKKSLEWRKYHGEFLSYLAPHVSTEHLEEIRQNNEKILPELLKACPHI